MSNLNFKNLEISFPSQNTMSIDRTLGNFEVLTCRQRLAKRYIETLHSNRSGLRDGKHVQKKRSIFANLSLILDNLMPTHTMAQTQKAVQTLVNAYSVLLAAANPGIAMLLITCKYFYLFSDSCKSLQCLYQRCSNLSFNRAYSLIECRASEAILD